MLFPKNGYGYWLVPVCLFLTQHDRSNVDEERVGSYNDYCGKRNARELRNEEAFPAQHGELLLTSSVADRKRDYP